MITRRPRNFNRADRSATGIVGNERMFALSDGIFAIVLTLLVFEIHVPDVPPAELAQALAGMWPKAMGYVISFVMIGLYWVIQHNMFQYIKRHDRPLLWFNLLFLMLVASMPFPSGLIVQYPTAQAPVILLAVTFIATGLALDLIWWYATSHRQLVDHRVDATLTTLVHQRLMVGLLIHLTAIGLSFVNVFAAKMMFILSVVLYILPSRLSTYHHQQAAPQGESQQAGHRAQE